MKNLFLKNKYFIKRSQKYFALFVIIGFFCSVNISFAADINYVLLEPLGGGATTSYDVKPSGLTTYISDITRYFFMIVAVISAFYLIYGGIQYLTTDMSSLKLEGKETIKRVIIGLIFIFSVWTVFNSINPNILRIDVLFGEKGTAKETSESESGPGPDTNPSTSSKCSAPAQIVQLENIKVCSTIKEDLEKLIAAAKADNIELRLSSGLRTRERQIELRTKNCGSTQYDIYEKPSGQCTPPTAIPGTSNHETGEAVDFSDMCFSKNPSKANCTDKKYKWLVDNASKYNFKNNTSEPWHWSKTGY